MLGVLPLAGITKNFGCHLRQRQCFIEFPTCDHARIAGDICAMEFQLDPAVKKPTRNASVRASSIGFSRFQRLEVRFRLWVYSSPHYAPTQVSSWKTGLEQRHPE